MGCAAGAHEVLTRFGVRAEFSPHNQRIAFRARSFGDAFVIDCKTRVTDDPNIRLAPSALPDGRYILLRGLLGSGIRDPVSDEMRRLVRMRSC
jgi:hypothetical protein